MSLKLLILDDEEALLRILKMHFTSERFEVDTAQQIDEAKELVGKKFYSAAIVDLALAHPDYTGGLDMVRYIRARSPRTKIIVHTGNINPQVRELAEQIGTDLFLEKPVPLEVLTKHVFRLCV